MTLLTSCAAVRDRLHAFIDGELPPAEHGAMLAHLGDCGSCASAADDYRSLGGLLRSGVDTTAVPMDTLSQVTARVVTLAAAEARQSLRVRLGHAFEDMRFVFAGAGSFAATFICAVSLAIIVQAAGSTSRADSLASRLEQMAAPRGSTENPYSVDPRILPPTVQQGSLAMPAILVDDVPYAIPDEQYAFSGVLTSDGRVAGIEMLQSGDKIDPRALELLHSIHESRFKPARLKDGRAVAVSFVWLHSDVTIRPKAM
jgi:hypothetical protein